MAEEIKQLWAVSSEKVFEQLDSSEKGLTNEESQKRLKEFGRNEVTSEKKFRGAKIFFSQFNNGFIILLIVATILSYFLGEKINAIVILVMIFFTTLFGFFQEYKAEKIIQRLKKYITLKSKVLREGKIVEIDSRNLVVGDIVYLEQGDVVPADLKLIKIKGLSVDESALTGESFPVIKTTSLISKEFKIVQDLHNMALMELQFQVD